jgi:hypothetical protein
VNGLTMIVTAFACADALRWDADPAVEVTP